MCPLSPNEMTTPFPFLRLPRLALISVFMHMEPNEVIMFALLSKRANKLSKSLRKLSASSIDLVVENDSHYLAVLFIYRQELPFNTSNFSVAETVSHEKVGLSVSEWIERVQDGTNCKSLKRVDLRGPPRLDMCDARSSLKNISELYIHPGCPNSFAKEALEILSPVTNEITMWSIPFENREEFRTFLRTNLDYLSIYHCASEIPKFEFSMDDVLIANPLKLDLIEGPSRVEDINQFFLNWLQNTIDSRMEHFSMNVRENVDEDNLLNGLDAVPF
ncbi:hypothetical protein GCK72_021251 [Caenorhabditis remanei]|uniref:F-box domain-containing protein n=1 Tax=Caenorhabditis remanei TaxID=31234 RepID=A0A6A5GHI4_CAERE|nr:hypothetical protein GCK72_021251 [Caenorhabditis remanei]KAF1754687.1 hypothetical protein GCK72_021251 [Caenorhabditis remanei]